MPLGPSILERLNRARADLRMGVPVVLTDAEGAALVVAAEEIDAPRLAGMRAMGRGPVAGDHRQARGHAEGPRL